MPSDLGTPEKHSTRRQRLLFAAGLFSLFLIELAAIDLLVPYDYLFNAWVQEQRGCGLDRIATLIRDWTTAPYLTVILLSAVGGFLALQRQWQELVSLIIIVAGAALLSEWFKELVARARPSALSVVTDGNSFPSGHATITTALLGGIYFLVSPILLTTRWRKFSGLLFVAVWVLVIGYQRIYFSHHWLSDVIGGFVLGSSWLLFVTAVLHGSANLRIWFAVAGAFAAAYWILLGFSSSRIRIAGPARMAHFALLHQIDFSSFPPDLVQARARRRGESGSEPILWRFMKAKTPIDIELVAGQDYVVRFVAVHWVRGGRPDCRMMEISINNRSLKRLLLLEGRREYQIAIDRAAVAEQRNRLIIEFDNPKVGPLLLSEIEIYGRLPAH